MDVSTPLAFLTDICSMYGINIAQVKVSFTTLTYQVVVLNATEICRVSKTWTEMVFWDVLMW